MAESTLRTGRPPRLSHADEWELYCYRKSGVAIKTCASMFRVSVPTANRIIAKFRAYDERIEPVAREFRENLKSIRDDVDRPRRCPIMAKSKRKIPASSPWTVVADASDLIAALVTHIPGWDYEHSDETKEELRQVALLLQQAIPLLEHASEREEAAHG